jgi:hypothetical protein
MNTTANNFQTNLTEEVVNAATYAISNPFKVKEFFVNGFKLMLHYDSNRKWYECVLHYSSNSSSYYHYSNDQNELVQKIQQSMESFGGKGKYIYPHKIIKGYYSCHA